MTDDLHARLWADNPATECPPGIRSLRKIRKVHMVRFGVRGEVLANLHPKTTNRYNCRADPLFMRKYRGNRKRFWIAYYRRNPPPPRTTPPPITNIPRPQRHPVWISGYKQVTP